MTTPRQTVTITHVTAYDEALTAEIAALEAKAAANPGKQRMSAKDDAADRRQTQAHDMNPQIGQTLGARLIMLDHVEVVGRPHPSRQGFQPHQHHS